MDKILKLTDDNWSYGSYHRIGYKRDMLYTFFQYVDLQVSYNVGMGTFTLKDRLAERLLAGGKVTPEMMRNYYGGLLQFMAQMQTFDTWPIEQIYGQIRRIRRQVFGAEVLEQDRLRQSQMGCRFQVQDGIDQSAKKEALIREKDALIVALCQPELFSLMKKDVEAALSHGCRVYVLVSDEKAAGLPAKEEVQRRLQTPELKYLTMSDEDLGLNFGEIQWEEEIQNAVDRDRAALLVYGEEGLLHCRNLRIATIVQAIPFGYHARAMVNQLDGERACVVYVPPHFDISEWVKMTEKTQLSYWQLCQLWQDHGDSIYEMSTEQLYRSFPQYFLNVYENGTFCPEAEEDYPIRVCWPEEREGTVADFNPLRDKAIADYINGQEGLTYLSTYFTDEGEEAPVPWNGTAQQTGVLVHGVRMAAAEKAHVVNCDTGLTLRQQLKASEQKYRSQDSEHSLQLFSNFLFFLTPKLAELYNQLREDRPQEQLHEKQGHLDYKLTWQDGKRVETFPLYRKAVLAKKRDGRFLLCQYRLGGGTLTVSRGSEVSCKISWPMEAVDPAMEFAKAGTAAEDPVAAEMPVQIYTPYVSWADQEAETNTYRRVVGESRVNLVIIQDKICCIRRGDVILPSIGVVVSLSLEKGEDFLRELGVAELGNGYWDVSDLELSIRLDGPAQIDTEQWRQVEWAYGGGLSLIIEGRSIYESDEMLAGVGGVSLEEAHGTTCLAAEGWLSPLSRQTQESALHVLAKHPRTAIGITKTGDLFVLVFSGRTRLSTGADYREMCRIAKRLIPDVEAMMNVDGGGSSVLGLAIDGHFMELSYPATSMNSCAGMVRQVNTVLCLEP